MRSLAGAALCLLLLGACPASAQVDFLTSDMCVRCHLIGGNLGAPNPVMGWRRSAHFRPDSGCAECHGGNKYFYLPLQGGHMGLPGAEAVNAMCGGCHKREASLFAARPPVRPGEPECKAGCADCHGYHELKPRGADFLNDAVCGKCHAFKPPGYGKAALEEAGSAAGAVRNALARMQEMDFPAEGRERELDEAVTRYGDVFHRARPAPLAGPPPDSPGKPLIGWYACGALAVGFWMVALILLEGYESSADGQGLGGEDGEMSGFKKIVSGIGTSWVGWLALLTALAALGLAFESRFSSGRAATEEMSRTVSTQVLPGLKRADERAAVNAVFELKRMVVTLDEIRETTDSPEVKQKIDALKPQIEELAVKVLVSE